jgi:hypothetical protein
MSVSARRTREKSWADRAPASAAEPETGLFPKPQFEAELGSQRPVRSHEPWAEVIGAQAGFDCQIHEAPDLRDVECFKGALVRHVPVATQARLWRLSEVCLNDAWCCTQGIPYCAHPAVRSCAVRRPAGQPTQTCPAVQSLGATTSTSQSMKTRTRGESWRLFG